MIELKNIGQFGVISDLPPDQLPPEAWSYSKNVSFNDRYAEKVHGDSEQFASPSARPYFILPLQTKTAFYWLYASLTDIYTSQHVKLSTTSYNPAGIWNGDTFGGIPVWTNGIDPPQALYPATVNDSVIDLPNWPANTVCRSIKGYRGYLIALNISDSTGDYPYAFRWSHLADPGFLPGSWDYSDPTKDAGQQDFPDDGGYIVDGGQLRDSFIIYRENAIQEARVIGGRFIFSFRKIFSNQGIYGPRCFVEFDGKHCVLTNNDLIIHDGNSPVSIADARQRDTLFGILDSATNNKTTFLTADYGKNEVWICYPTGSDSFPTKALIWNYRHNTFGHRDLPGVNDAKYNIVHDISSDVWDNDSEVWDDDSEVWDATLYDPTNRAVLMADTENSKLLKANSTNQFDGTNFEAILRRDGLTFGDLTKIKKVKSVYPSIEAPAGTVVEVTFGYQMAIGEPITWDSGHTFTVGTDYKIDPNISGRLIAHKYRTIGDVEWKIHGMTFDVVLEGAR